MPCGSIFNDFVSGPILTRSTRRTRTRTRTVSYGAWWPSGSRRSCHGEEPVWQHPWTFMKSTRQCITMARGRRDSQVKTNTILVPLQLKLIRVNLIKIYSLDCHEKTRENRLIIDKNMQYNLRFALMIQTIWFVPW